jgi:hypothetical protein
LGDYDTIIAFEVIEHLDNGLELVEKLKDYCKCLIISVPYAEPPGFWGKHHKLHFLTESMFKDFEIKYMKEDGEILDKPFGGEFYLMLMKWMPKVTATISTKDRYFTTLPLTLCSIALQSRTPDKLIIFDDGEQKDLREEPLYNSIFKLFDNKKIEWKVIYGQRRGQVANHQKALEIVDTDLIWRVDDDNIIEPNVLEKLMSHMKHDVGAVSCLSIIPRGFIDELPDDVKGEIKDLLIKPNVQWFKFKGTKEVEYLYNTFLFKRKLADNYPKLSIVGHCEESLFTYNIKRKGVKLLVDGDVMTWHFRFPVGGIRSFRGKEMYDNDEAKAIEILRSQGVDIGKSAVIVLDNGLGDHWILKKVLPEIKKRYSKIIIACCYPEVFEDEDVELVSIDYANGIKDVNVYNVYRWCAEKGWTKSLEEAYKEML